jgi:hypothetical protein
VVSALGLLIGLLVLALISDGLVRWLRRLRVLAPASATEELGRRILLGLAGLPWVCMLLDLTGIPITRLSVGVVASGVGLAGYALDRGWVPGARARADSLAPPPAGPEGAALLRSPAALGLALASASLILFSLIHTSLYPPRTYDGLVGYDLVGKIMAYEGRITSSVFSRLAFNAQCVYPPFTATNEGFWYLFHPALPQLWVPLVAGGFALVVWARVRRWTGSPTVAGLTTFLMLTPPELAFHLTVGQTDLASMAYVALAMFATVEAVRGRAGALGEASLYALLATTVRNENALFALALALVAGIAGRRRAGRAVLVFAPAAAFFAFWNLVFVRGRFGYDPGQHFRRTLDVDPGRMLEVLRLAAKNIASPGTFGELVYAIPLAIALWALGRRGRRRGGFAPEPDLHLTGPLLVALGVCFVAYLPFFYQWDPKLNPLWSMDHTFKRGFFRFVPGLVAALLVAPPALSVLRRCDGRGGKHDG